MEGRLIRGYHWVPAVDFNRVHGIISYSKGVPQRGTDGEVLIIERPY